MELTEQQKHLESLLKQREDLARVVERNRELLFKVTGAIEYLTQAGVTLPVPEEQTAPEQQVNDGTTEPGAS